jgi:hypothetical protein
VISAFVTPPVLIFERTCARKPIEESCLLEKIQGNPEYSNLVISQPQNIKDNLYNLSEIVFSKSTKAPPQMKRMFFVSICNARQMHITV